MKVRKATEKDIKSLVRHLQNKHIGYFTIEHMKKDIENKNMYLLIDNDKIICSCSVVETEFDWLGVKRLCIFNKKNNGKGYAKIILKSITDNDKKYCITPWEDNKAMIHIVEKIGFEYKYTFNEKWLCYLKNA